MTTASLAIVIVRATLASLAIKQSKPGLRKMVHKSAGDDLGHDLVRLVDALAALISQCEGEGGGTVGGGGWREGFGRDGHGYRGSAAPRNKTRTGSPDPAGAVDRRTVSCYKRLLVSY